jgi:hypothetical protein
MSCGARSQANRDAQAVRFGPGTKVEIDLEAQCRAFITESRAEAFEIGFNFSRTLVTQTKSGRSRYHFVGGRFTEMQMLRP